MYEVDDLDSVVELRDIPQSDVGAPIPMVIGDGHTVVVAYYLQDTPEDWDGTSVKVVGPDTDNSPVSVVKFNRCYASMFGPPNDEAFSGHPLSSKGLRPYGAYRIENSSWVRRLERMNSVHQYHDKEEFMKTWKHFVLSFHDETFECIAEEYVYRICKGSVKGVLSYMLEQVE